MGFRWVFAAGAFLWGISPAYGFDSCPFLIATSLTETGGATFALGKHGEFNFVEDWRVPGTQQPRWKHKIAPTALPPSSLLTVRHADVMTDIDPHDGVWTITAGWDNQINWVNPLGFSYRVTVDGFGSPTGVSFYRPDIFFALSRSGIDPNAPSTRHLEIGRSILNNNVTYPGELWLALDQDIYRAQFKLRPIGELAPLLADKRFPLRLRQDAIMNPAIEFFNETSGEIELQRSQEHMYWLETSDPKVVLEVYGLERMFTATTKHSIDYVRVMTPHKVMVGNELGELQIWDHHEGRLLAAPQFTDPVWISEMAAVALKGQYEVWALHTNGKDVYRWESGFDGGFMRKLAAEDLPQSAGKFTGLSATSQIMPEVVGLQRGHSPAWIRYPIIGGLPLRVNRVLLSTADGAIHGSVDNSPLAGAPVFNERPAWLPYRIPDPEDGG